MARLLDHRRLAAWDDAWQKAGPPVDHPALTDARATVRGRRGWSRVRFITLA